MWARGISIDDLATSIRNSTSYAGAGQFDGNSGTALLRPHGQLEEANDYSDVIVSNREGAPVYLRDVAQVTDSVQDERINMRFWVRGYGAPSATVVIAVFRQAGANAVDVAKNVRALLPVISAELPGSVRITPIYDRSRTIVNSVNDVRETLLIAFVLVVLVIFLFLGRATDTLIPAVALPLSLLLTFMVMGFLGYSLDNLSLMALTLAIGFLVDDAIVFLENTVRRMERGEEVMEATINSAKEISFTIIAMTISLAAVFFPLVFMPGLVGRIFREFAITIVVAIFASGLVSLTLTPLMCARLLKKRGQGSDRKKYEEDVMRPDNRNETAQHTHRKAQHLVKTRFTTEVKDNKEHSYKKSCRDVGHIRINECVPVKRSTDSNRHKRKPRYGFPRMAAGPEYPCHQGTKTKQTGSESDTKVVVKRESIGRPLQSHELKKDG